MQVIEGKVDLPLGFLLEQGSGVLLLNLHAKISSSCLAQNTEQAGVSAAGLEKSP